MKMGLSVQYRSPHQLFFWWADPRISTAGTAAVKLITVVSSV